MKHQRWRMEQLMSPSCDHRNESALVIGEIFGIIGWDPSVCKSNRLHADILWCSFIKLGYVLWIPMKWSVIFLQSWTSTGYFSNSTGSSATKCHRFSPIIDHLHSADHVGKTHPLAADALTDDRPSGKGDQQLGRSRRRWLTGVHLLPEAHRQPGAEEAAWRFAVCQSMLSPWDPDCWKPANARVLKIWRLCLVAGYFLQKLRPKSEAHYSCRKCTCGQNQAALVVMTS
jgi:hypothetical protein